MPRSSVLRKRVSSSRSVSVMRSCGAAEFGIGGTHLAHQRRHQPPHQGLLGAEQFGMAHGAPHDAAQHIAAALIRRQHAIGDEEGGSAQMIGDHPVGCLVPCLRPARW